ncbi:MAG: YihY/virulence factor BrkB family protein [Dongiaceae bacterium]
MPEDRVRPFEPVRRMAWLLASLGFVYWAAGAARRPARDAEDPPEAAGGQAQPPRVGRARRTGRTDPATVNQSGRGRQAETPGEIPARGWKDILLRVWDRLSRDNISIIAAGVAFYALTSIPPGLAAFISIYGLVFDPGTVQSQVDSLSVVLPHEAVGIISDQLKAIVAKPPTKLGFSLLVSLGLALWSTRAGMATMMTALNVAYEEEEKRSFVRFLLVSLALTLCAILFGVVTLALVAVLPAVIDLLPLGEAGRTISSIVRWPVLVVIVMIGLAALYRFAPSRDQPRWRWVSWGAVIATVLWIAASALFSLYVGSFGSYDRTYGSLGAIVVLLMWLYLSAYIVLAGAELNAEMEHQTARDTTAGPARPMGLRGAEVADTVGVAKS